MKAVVLGDLISDINMRVPSFPVKAKDIYRLSHLDLGPGGACNTAIMAARFGVQVSALGETGDDKFGEVVRDGLVREGVDASAVVVSTDAHTPVAGVIVDKAGEPAYLGYGGDLRIRTWPSEWTRVMEASQAVYADGWAEYPHTPALLLSGFRAAQNAGVVVFFDPGPGNSEVDNGWVREAVSRTNVLLVNRAEGQRLAGDLENKALAYALLDMGPSWVVLKRGADGLLLANRDEIVEVAGLPVRAIDTTGAGDSVSGAMLYGLLHGLPIEKLAVLCNSTGAAKVQKRGTGHNLPTLDEIATVLVANGYTAKEFLG
jgi:sugar/nucleoside kinase (ribokinase family)